MSYKYKSGAQKRREKCEKEKDARKGQLSLGHFFTSKHPSPSEIDTTQTHQDSSSQDNDAGEYSRDSSSPRPVPEPKCKGKDAAEAASPRPVPEPMCDVQELVFSSESEKFCDVGDPNFDVYVDLKYPHLKLPSIFPDDRVGASVPVSIFKKKLTNGELVPRDWLVWSRLKEAFYCLPCKLFSSVQPAKQSLFASSDGYSAAQRWKKMYDRVPEHEGTPTHKSSYIQWRMEVKKIKSDSSLNDLLLKSMVSEREKWKEILKRLLHVTLFLAERGLAFRGDSCKIGDPSNGNFLGLLELLGNYDPVLSQHLETVRQSQENGTRLQVHYLSPETQNELIEACSAQIVQMILKEREKAKYYSIIVDATPDTSHVEQTAIIIRYLHFEGEEESYEVKERLLAFADCSQKTGVAIADLIIKKLNEYRIPLSDCRGQGYDNGSNMKGAYKGVQAIILGMNSLAVYSACACHSLNLCGEQAAECCPPAITFFGAVQKLYNIFSSSPQRWEIFQANVPNNLHSMSQTRWSARVDSVKPIARHLPGVLKALDDVLKLNLTSECRRDVLGLQKHLKTFNFLLLSSIWTKILQAVDIVNKVIQQRGGTLDVASTNLNNLIEELKVLRNERWDEIFHETQAVAKNIGWPTFLEEEGKRSKKRKKLWDDDNEETDPEQSESKLPRCFQKGSLFRGA